MRKSFVDRLLLPAIVGLITVLAALLLFQRLLTEQRAEIKAATRAQALFAKNKLEAELNSRILPLDRLAERWEVLGEQDDVEMRSDATLIVGYGGFRSIQWVDPAVSTRWAVPTLQIDSSDPRERAALLAARDSGRIVVTPSIHLGENNLLFLICEPVIAENELNGFLVGAIAYQDLFSSAFESLGRNYGVAVYDGDQKIFGPAESSSPQAQELAEETTGIPFRQVSWRIIVWPNSVMLLESRSPLPKAALFGGILMATLLGFAVYMGETAHTQAFELAANNKKLREEISMREQAEEALRQAQKMEAIGRLAGGIAHDFNNLLTVIRGHAALEINSPTYGNTKRQGMSEILKAADRASSLTRKLLAFSRKQVLQPRVLDLNSVVTQAVELFSPSLGEKVEVCLSLASDLGRINADSVQLEQIIINLVFNARDAMPNGGTVTIATTNTVLDESWTGRYPEIRPGPHVLLTVTDMGCGMDENTVSHVFEPFFTTKEVGKGTGLGLATVYGTISQSGGCVGISSKLGQGTTIQIYLPQVEDAIEVVAEPTVVPKVTRPTETILVVDDDDAVRRMTITFLKIAGYTVVEARSPAEALDLVEHSSESINLVLTDVSMPKMTGRELVEKLLKVESGLKVLYMSAYTEDAAINCGLHNPGTAFIEKPFSPDDLARKVREVLATQPHVDHAKCVQHHA